MIDQLTHLAPTGALIFVFVLVVSTWMWACVSIPSSLSSLFRYKLWKLRDDIVIAMENEELASHEAVSRLIDATENMIARAEYVRITTWIFAPKLPKDAEIEVKHYTESYAKIANQAQRDKFAEFELRLKKIIFLHLAFGSPSGWLVLAFFLALAICKTITRRGLALCRAPFRELKPQLVEIGTDRLVPGAKVWRSTQQIRLDRSSRMPLANLAG